MRPFVFVHAADLHLDAPFRGMSAGVSGACGGAGAVNVAEFGDDFAIKILRDSTFTALDRLIRLCLEVKADFLVLAGDVYNSKDSSLRARLALGKAFAELGKAGVRVFLAHGNHDPYTGPDPAIPWPDNVNVFGEEVSCSSAERDGAEIARIYGVSHASERESRNLAKLLQAQTEAEQTSANTGAGRVFGLGVLHCSLAGNSAGHEPYAPCSTGDLKDTGLDYLALGHVHGTRIFQLGAETGSLVAAYPGSLQGLTPNEPGQRGCLVVRVDGDGRAQPSFAPLAPVAWEDLEFSLEQPGYQAGDDATLTLTEAGGDDYAVEKTDEDAMDIPALCAGLAEKLAVSVPGIETNTENLPEFPLLLRLATIRLTGATPLDSMLRKPGALDDLRTYLAGMLPPDVIIRKIKLETKPARDLQSCAERADLIGEIAKLMQSAASCSDEDRAVLDDMAVGLDAFFNSDKVRRKTSAPDDAELRELIRQAGYLCLDLLEDD